MKTAIKCTEFVDVLDAEQVYSIVALSAYQSKNFGRCSWALIKLKTMSEGDDKFSLELKKLVSSISSTSSLALDNVTPDSRTKHITNSSYLCEYSPWTSFETRDPLTRKILALLTPKLVMERNFRPVQSVVVKSSTNNPFSAKSAAIL